MNRAQEIAAQFARYENELSTLLRKISAQITCAKEEIKHMEYTIHCLRSNNLEVSFATPITAMGFSIRISNALQHENMYWVGDLVDKSRAYLMHTPNLGRKSIAEIQEKLGHHGLHLEMDVPGWEEVRQELYKLRESK